MMVRVGGGWDTLRNYLERHDPCKVVEFKRSASKDELENDDDKFLFIHGKYKRV